MKEEELLIQWKKEERMGFVDSGIMTSALLNFVNSFMRNPQTVSIRKGAEILQLVGFFTRSLNQPREEEFSTFEEPFVFPTPCIF